jgi:hypothetical protein
MALTAKSDMVDKDNVAVRFVMTDDVTGTVVLITVVVSLLERQRIL